MSEPISQGVLATFGVNGKLLIAQLFNVGIILLVAARWIYRPLLRLLDDRGKIIEDGLTHAAQAKQELAGAHTQRANILAEAEGEARTIIERAWKEGEEARDVLKEQTRQDLERQLQEAKQRLQEEKNVVLRTVQQELAELVVLVTRRALSGISVADQRVIVEEEIKKMQKTLV